MNSINQISTICVFAGSADGLSANYHQAAHQLGAELARRNISLVYGGGKTGLMGAVANGALQSGGSVIGVVPENLFQPQLIHTNLTKLEILPDIHKRKARMSALADAFIALPGGFGTFDELFETLTWSQIGLHKKPVGILNTEGYFDAFLNMVHIARQEGFIYSEHRSLFVTAFQPDALLDQLSAHQFPDNIDHWVERPDGQ